MMNKNITSTPKTLYLKTRARHLKAVTIVYQMSDNELLFVIYDVCQKCSISTLYGIVILMKYKNNLKKKTQPLGIKLSAKEDSMTGEVGCTVQPPMRKYKLTFRKEGSSLHFCKVMQISPMNHTE